MRRRWLIAVGMITLFAASCNYVTQDEFEAYKLEIQTDGDNVDVWIAAAHQWILFLNQNINKICPGCAPPALPPDPPPDGDWK